MRKRFGLYIHRGLIKKKKKKKIKISSPISKHKKRIGEKNKTNVCQRGKQVPVYIKDLRQ